MIGKSALAAFTVALASCTTHKAIFLPDGRQGHAIGCATWSECYAKAGEICAANGYEIVDRTNEERTVIGGSTYGVAAGTAHDRMIVIACK